MNIIQSFWTLPMLKGQPGKYETRFHGGWLHQKYHYMSWAYSCLQLRKFYNNVSLITDVIGNELLIEQLGLPYTNVTIALDELNNCHPELWALGKVYSYGLQEDPFLHVDGDVYIWERFHKKFETSGLIAQNLEHNFSYYKSTTKSLIDQKCYIPDVITQITSNGNEVNAYNAGVLGGSNILFFKRYVKAALEFVDNNIQHLPMLPVGKINAFFEQHLFYCISKKEQLKVDCIFDIIDKEKLNFILKSHSQFAKAPADGVKYIHLYGEDCKMNIEHCKRLEALMRDEFPDYYQRILKLSVSKHQQII